MQDSLPRPTDTKPEVIHIPGGPELSPAPQAKRRGPAANLMDEDEPMDGTVRRPGSDFFGDHKELMKKASTAEMIRRSGRQSIEVRIDIGECPDGCPREVWHELQAIHVNMGHPSNASLTRMPLRHGCRPEIIEYVQQIACSICVELSRRSGDPQTSSGKLEATAFRDVLAVDEFFVTLTGGNRVMLVIMVDVASRLAVTFPIARATTSVTAEELVEALERAWLSWAGAPKKLRADPAKAHIAKGIELFCREHASTPDISPAEAHNHASIVERRIMAWKEVFVSVNRELSLTIEDRTWKWTSRIDAMNTHLRSSGYSPYHFVFGRDPYTPTSLLRDDSSLSAMSAAVCDGDAQRSEMMRQGAVQATLRLDSPESLRRAVHSNTRTSYQPLAGDMVYWWRQPERFSKILQRETGWRGPGIVARATATKVLIIWMGGMIEVSPQQCRKWSRDEKDMLHQYVHLIKLAKEQFENRRQIGYRDLTGEGPPTLEQYNQPPPGAFGPQLFIPDPAPPPTVPPQAPTAPAAAATVPAPAPGPAAVDVRDVDVLAPETEQPEAPQSDAVSLKQKVEKKPKVIRGKAKAKAKAKPLALEDEPKLPAPAVPTPVEPPPAPVGTHEHRAVPPSPGEEDGESLASGDEDAHEDFRDAEEDGDDTTQRNADEIDRLFEEMEKEPVPQREEAPPPGAAPPVPQPFEAGPTGSAFRR